MPKTSSGRATLILGIPYFVGVVLILLSGWDVIPGYPVPWDQIVLGSGAALMAATLGLGVANVRQGSKRNIFLALLGMLAVLVMLIITQGWKTELIAFVGVVAGVLLAEGVLSWMLRRWCP